MLDNRRERAKALGEELLDPRDGDVEEQIKDRNGGIGADVVIDCVGTERSLNSSLALARKAGRVSLVGILSSNPTIDIARIGIDERELVGSLAYAHDFPRAIALVEDGRST